MPALVLASTSIYRRELLTRLGVPFSAVAPTCDEEALKDPALLPAELAAHLAREKARSLAPHHPDAHVLGSDQLVEIDGQVLGKPFTRDNAIAQLSGLGSHASPHHSVRAREPRRRVVTTSRRAYAPLGNSSEQPRGTRGVHRWG